MKLFKSLLLASATGLVAVSGASAADLGVKKPSPVEYVRACYNPLWGTSGGFVIPGTQTCLRVFGQARFDAHYAQPYIRTQSLLGYRGGMTVGLDAITPSEYGNVRAFASIGAMYRSGNQLSGSNARVGWGFNGTFPGLTNSGGQTEINYTGFIQFAGFTMGRTASFFGTVGAPAEIIGTTARPSIANVNVFAYTAQLGNGFLATVAIEDPTTRRQPINSGSFVTLAGAAVVPNFAAAAGSAVTNFAQIGNRMPNFVAALRVDQAWGSAEIAGIATEVGMQGAAGAAGTLAAGQFFVPSAKIGWAVNAGLKINLPMIAAGDNFTLNGVYTEGSLAAVISNPICLSCQFVNVGGVAAVTPDAVFNTATGGIKLTKGWGVTAGFQHFWAPTLSSAIFGSYAQVDVPNTPLALGDTLRDFTYWNVGANIAWQPVRGLNFVLEGAYITLDPKGTMVDVQKNVTVNGAFIGACNAITGAGCALKSSDSQFVTRFRVTRDF